MDDLSAASREVVNALTINVGEHFHDFAFSACIPRASWDVRPSRVAANVERILDLLAEHEARATFFMLGWIAERHPQLIRRIVESGHEIASNGYDHTRAINQGWGPFLADVRLAKAILEDVSSAPVAGYRTPGFSISLSHSWAFECIAEGGYRYSSCIYPTGLGRGAPRFAHEVRPGLLEIPVTTGRTLRLNWPAGGGESFRLLPYAVSHWLIRRVNDEDHQPAMFHFRAWDLDSDESLLAGTGPSVRIRHHANRKQMAPRLRQLLTDFRWGRVDTVFPVTRYSRKD